MLLLQLKHNGVIYLLFLKHEFILDLPSKVKIIIGYFSKHLKTVDKIFVIWTFIVG